MEISELEYLALKCQVQELQNQINSMNSPKPVRVTNLASMVSEQVIDHVRNMADSEPVFGYRSSANNDTWVLMLQMAKNVHETSNVFRMETRRTWDGAHTRPYINMVLDRKKPRKISDLAPEQVDLSVQMLNEMIPIYNRYFKMIHQKVLYDPTGRGDYEPVGVMDGQILAE